MIYVLTYYMIYDKNVDKIIKEYKINK